MMGKKTRQKRPPEIIDSDHYYVTLVFPVEMVVSRRVKAEDQEGVEEGEVRWQEEMLAGGFLENPLVSTFPVPDHALDSDTLMQGRAYQALNRASQAMISEPRFKAAIIDGIRAAVNPQYDTGVPGVVERGSGLLVPEVYGGGLLGADGRPLEVG
jgi:hypothetical protein